MKTEFAKISKTELTQLKHNHIISTFALQNQKLKYFIDSPAIQGLYVSCYNSIEAYFMQNGMDAPNDLCFYAYKVMFLFQTKDLSPVTTLKNFDKFANSFVNNNDVLKSFLSQDSYRAFYFPSNKNYAEFSYDVNTMRANLTKIGLPILKNIVNLPKIQKVNQDKFPKNLEEFKQAALKVKFPSAEKNMQLATLVNYYDGDNSDFQEMLTLLSIKTLLTDTKDGKIIALKATDNLPNVIAKYTNPTTNSIYHLVKLPANDFRALMLGDITGNCQTLGNNDADAFIIDGIIRPNNGFYVIIKQGKKSFDPAFINWNHLEQDSHEIIGQTYAWIGRDGKTITWEAPQLIKDRAHNIDIKELFVVFGKEVEKEGFDRVTIGAHDQGFKGAKNFMEGEYTKVIDNSIIMEGFRYHYSSAEQYEVYTSAQLNEVRKQLSIIIGSKYDINSVTSVSQGQALINFLQGKPLSPTAMKILMSSYLTKDWHVDKLESLLSSIKLTSDNKLNLIVSDDIQKFYKHGLTTEYALKMSYDVLSLLISLPSNYIEKAPLFLQSGINLDELIEKIIPITTIDQLHREIVKLMAKQLCNDIGDLGYIDTMSSNKIDFLVNSQYSNIDMLYKKHYIIRNLNELDDEKFAILATNYYLIKGICNSQGISINNFIDKYDSSLALKQGILKFIIQEFSEFNQINLTCDYNAINNLSSEQLDLLLRQDVLESIFEIAQTENIKNLQEIIPQYLEQNNDSIFDPSYDSLSITYTGTVSTLRTGCELEVSALPQEKSNYV